MRAGAAKPRPPCAVTTRNLARKASRRPGGQPSASGHSLRMARTRHHLAGKPRHCTCATAHVQSHAQRVDAIRRRDEHGPCGSRRRQRKVAGPSNDHTPLQPTMQTKCHKMLHASISRSPAICHTKNTPRLIPSSTPRGPAARLPLAAPAAARWRQAAGVGITRRAEAHSTLKQQEDADFTPSPQRMTHGLGGQAI